MKKIFQFFQKLRKPVKEEKLENEFYGFEGCGCGDGSNDCSDSPTPWTPFTGNYGD